MSKEGVNLQGYGWERLRSYKCSRITNIRLRDELLTREIFTMLREAKVLIEEWRREYNQVRLHSALGYPATCSRGYKANSNAGNSN